VESVEDWIRQSNRVSYRVARRISKSGKLPGCAMDQRPGNHPRRVGLGGDEDLGVLRLRERNNTPIRADGATPETKAPENQDTSTE
jgi:hypothetical protein